MSERMRRRALARSVAGALGRALAVAAIGGAATGVAHAQEDVRLPRGGEDASLPGQASIVGPGAAVSRSLAGLLPRDGRVVSGSATIAGDGGRLTISQSSNRAIINWQSFDIGAGNSVVFAQPDAGSATLNRVTGATSSTIAGQLSATGSVFLINPNGIVITASGTVQAGGGFVASTLDIADGDFNAGRLVFTGSGASKAVSNAGTIRVGAGGYAALLGGSVSHGGTIDVPLGRVGIGSGEQVALDLSGDGFLRVAVPTQALVGEDKALVELAGQIASAGGRVEVRAATVADAVRNVINFTGTISADSAVGDGGTIILIGGADPQNMAGTARYSGTLSARATGASGNGGFVETSGQDLKLDGVRVDTRAANGRTGTWLIDPVTLTVDAAAAGTIGTNLATANVTLQTTSTTASGPGVQDPTGAGDIIINSAISWSSSNSLSLLAFNNITINALLNGPFGSLVLTAGNNIANTGAITTGANGLIDVGLFNLTNGNWSQNSATLPAFRATDFRFDVNRARFLRVTGGTGASATPYTIADIYGLQGVASTNLLGSAFRLANDVDASGTAQWNGGAGFVPLGTDGAGNVWTGGSFSSSGQSGYSGTFNGQGFAVLGLTIARPSANNVGLFGAATGTISNLGLRGGSVQGAAFVGGLIGYQNSGSVTQSYSTLTVSSTTASGAQGRVGGLIGYQVGTISQSYATGAVTSQGSYVGGLAGYQAGSITGSFATGAVTGSFYAGGLVGLAAATIGQSYATGTVIGDYNVGGLAGGQNSSITESYSVGRVTGNAGFVGGLVGTLFGGSTTNSYWNTTTSGQSGSASGSGLTTAQLTAALPTGFSTSFWANAGNRTTPYLTVFGTAPISGTVIRAIETGATPALFNVVANVAQLQAINTTGLSLNYVLGNNIDAAATATWSGGLGFVPLGTDGFGGVLGSSGFTGSFDGLGYVISGLFINRGASTYTGLIGYSSALTVSNLYLLGGSVTGGATGVGGDSYTGALVGFATTATITRVGSSVTVNGGNGNAGVDGQAGTGGSTYTGGIAGRLNGGTISATFATGAVTGGLGGRGGTGQSGPPGSPPVTGGAGGTGGSTFTGGVVGLTFGTISQSYATGAVTWGAPGLGGGGGTGGVAFVNGGFIIGPAGPLGVRGNASVGGLAGYANTISGSWSSGAVTGSLQLGGFAGGAGSITNSYWDSYSSGWSFGLPSGTPAGLTAVTSDPAQSAAANYAYRASAYANLPAGANLGTTNASGFVFMPGNSTRPFLAFEVPSAATSGTDFAGRILIQSANQLQLIGYDGTRLSGNYVLARDLDLSATGAVTAGTPGSYAGMWSSAGFVPIGTDGAGRGWNGTAFTTSVTGGGYSGSFNGGGFTIGNLTITRGVNFVGLFGVTSGGIGNVGLVSGRVSGVNNVGALAGITFGPIVGSYATVNVTGSGSGVGGLVGSASAFITRSFATGTVSGAGTAGGLVGIQSSDVISQSYATGAVSSTSGNAGGLAGSLTSSPSVRISQSYATGAVSGNVAGGLVGIVGSGSVDQSYATGRVSGGTVGGLAGAAGNGTSVSNSYWDSYSTGQSAAVGSNNATVTNVSAVTSDPAQAAAANYAYRASAYANLPTAANLGTTSVSGFVFMPGNSTRPFLSFEVPSAATSGTDSAGRILIQTANQLQLIGYDATRLAGSYALARSLDLSATGAVVSGTPGSYAGLWSSAGWVPIGSDGAGNFWNGTGFVALNTITAAPYGFSGSLSGAGFAVTNLAIRRSTVNNVGLFGLLSGNISSLSIGGAVTGRNGVGGLAGLTLGATITSATSSVNVVGNNHVGGLVGNLNTGSTVTRSSASGTASGASNVGGLIGFASGATVSRSSASGAVTGTGFYAGGLIGLLDTTTLTDSFASGAVGGATSAGGLIGRASGGSVTNTYAIGAVTATAFASGLIGTRVNGGTVTASYWNTETTGQASSLGGGTGLTSQQFQFPSQTDFVGWDFTNIWTPPGTRPTLRP